MHRHHHHPDRTEQEQIDYDEQMAAQMQAEEESGYSQQEPRGAFPGQQYHSQPQYQGYNQGPPQGYQGGPPQGYQGGPPQGYQGGPPQGYQQGSPHGYQQGPPQGYHQGPPGGYQGGPPQGCQGRPPQDYQQGPPQGFQGGPPHQAVNPMQNSQRQLRRKSLLIGINYTGSQHALRGCQQDVSNMMQFLSYKGYSSDARSQVVMRDDNHTDPRGPFWPTGKNILAAMHWLVSEPGTCNFLHYSGHGGQVRDPDGDRDSGFDDTIVPLDYETNGQLDSDKLHRTLVSALPPSSTLFVVFDCCHSGSAIELPFVYRSDADGNVSMVDNVKASVNLLSEAGNLIQGGFSMSKLVEAKDLFSQASTLFRRFQHGGEQQEEGVGEEHFVEDWKSEHKFATMFSGCRDDQTSADANIGGQGVGAMSWAFLEVMKRNPNPTYLNTLQQTRQVLGQSHYKQVPQLSIGFKEMALDQPLRF
ncbi:caspase domain-containing protein [Neohortaea acidophila]|uniref:Caspase domain-containing protein n=1 Tax=Neohortaea acidophila TaxID=245834 RepID=A0A6A6PVG1_9PEZI|nr:caspase domain-containing protein [Neohortaea acidophila]KAF2483786.1 caspase domain-containing protein [Neohortaea acidophila]